MAYIFNTLAPVFLIIALGAWLRHARFFSEQSVKSLNNLTYWVALPTLLFYKIASSSFDFWSAGRTFSVVCLGMIACMIVGYIAAFLMRLPGESVGAFVQGAFRGNLVYVGLPVIMFSFDGMGTARMAELEKICIFTLAMIVPVYNVAAVIVLLASQHKLDRKVPLRILNQIIRNPLIIACLLGLVYTSVFSKFPVALERTCVAIGKLALPLALLGIGATLMGTKDFSDFKHGIVAALIKVFVAPLVGIPLSIWLGLTGSEKQIALLFLACPTAVASFILAEQLGAKKLMAASVVILTSMLSVLSFTGVLLYLN